MRPANENGNALDAMVAVTEGRAAEIERMDGRFRPLGTPLLTTHLWDLFATIRARLSGREMTAARAAEDRVELSLDTYAYGMHPSISGVLTDPTDGQRYRVLIVPASAEVIVR
jgi:hypothetical protein